MIEVFERERLRCRAVLILPSPKTVNDVLGQTRGRVVMLADAKEMMQTG